MKDKPDTSVRGWKDKYRALAYGGFEWGGWLADEGLHFFVKGNYSTGFTTVKCRDSELFDGGADGRTSFHVLVDTGTTR